MPKSPLPPREGISATPLRAPGGKETHALADAEVPATVGDWLTSRFPHATESDVADLVTTGELCTAAGTPVTLTDPVVPGGFYFFHRPVPAERPVPFAVDVVYEDEELLVVDKPHFLASTPNGRFVRQCVVTRLRVERDEPDLVAIHRLDRVTAGLLVLSRNPATRGKYQSLFQDKKVTKEYRALAAVAEAVDTSVFPLTRISRLVKIKGTRQVHEEDGAPNSESHISFLGFRDDLTAGGRIGEFALAPVTGKTHQLRVHMNALGLPIIGDPVYPVDIEQDPYDFTDPLQLLAFRLEFRDPLTGREREFLSRRQLVPGVVEVDMEA